VRILTISRRYPTLRQPAQPPDNQAQIDELAAHHELRLVRPVPTRASLVALRAGRARGSETATSVCPTFPEPSGLWSARHVIAFADSVRSAVAAITRQFEPEVVLASWTHPDGWTALRIGRELGVPVVLKTYGPDDSVRVQDRILARMIDELRSVDLVVAASRAAARAVLESGVPRRRVHVVPDGTSSPQPPRTQREARRHLQLPETDRIIVCFGEGVSASNALDLVKACAILRGQGVVVRCVFVGMGHGTRPVHRLIRSRGLEDLVSFSPPTQTADKRSEWIAASDLVAYPGYTDQAAPVLREALASGKPFVATRVGSIPELAAPGFGRLVLAGAAGEMANAIRESFEQAITERRVQAARLTIPWTESTVLLAAHLQAVVDRQATLRTQRARREDAASRTLQGRDATARRLDTGLDVDKLRKIASRRRS